MVLQPLPYHVELRDYLKQEERELWDWFASARARADYGESLRLHLLKSTYRLDRAGHPEVYESAERARDQLGLNLPLTIYQEQNPTGPNAALCFLEGEGHLVLAGPIATLLTPTEFQAIMGHELAHYLLWQAEDGEFQIAERLLQAVTQDPRAGPSHLQSARRYRLFTEVYADRGACRATGDLNVAVASLVKMHTGLHQVSAESYLKQAEEIFANAKPKTEELEHPESFIRARALALWKSDPTSAEPEIRGMIEGDTALDELDLVGQARATKLTQRLLAQVLRPNWFQTPAVLGHAKMFFGNFQPASATDETLLGAIQTAERGLKEFMAAILLDLVMADPDLEPVPLAAALDWSARLGLEAQFDKLAAKELKIKARELKKARETAAATLAQAEAQA